jgi:hypothetical protein
MSYFELCIACFNTLIETDVIGVQTSCIMAWILLVILDVTFLIHCNSTTNPAIDAGIIALEISESPLLQDVLDVSKLLLKRKLTGFKQVVSRRDFNW